MSQRPELALPTPAQVHMLVGGGADKKAYQFIAREAGVNGIVVASFASTDPSAERENAEEASYYFGLYGIAVTSLSSQDFADGRAMEKIHDQNAIYVTGGDQLKAMSLLSQYPEVCNAILGFRLLAGSSAGASLWAECMPYDMSSTPGLALWKNTIIDQHCAERGRVGANGRLPRLVQEHTGMTGIGINERVILARKGNTAQVLGPANGEVWLYPPSQGQTGSTPIIYREGSIFDMRAFIGKMH